MSGTIYATYPDWGAGYDDGGDPIASIPVDPESQGQIVPTGILLESRAEQTVTGTPNSLPTVSTPMQAAGGSWDMARVQGAINTIGSTARDVGTIVGTAQRQLATAGASFNTARANAEGGNKIGQWWQYSSTTDKLTVGIGVAGLLLILWK